MRVTRRNFLCLSGLVFLPGCIGGNPIPCSEEREEIDIQNMKKIEDFINNLRVKELAEKSGLEFKFNTEPHPPVVTGDFSFSGSREFPSRANLMLGRFRLSDQDEMGYADLDYKQNFFEDGERLQSGTNLWKANIRGRNNDFTIYSVIRVSDSSLIKDAIEDAVLILDGKKESEEKISARYIFIPSKSSPDLIGFYRTAGKINLERLELSSETREEGTPPISVIDISGMGFLDLYKGSVGLLGVSH